MKKKIEPKIEQPAEPDFDQLSRDRATALRSVRYKLAAIRNEPFLGKNISYDAYIKDDALLSALADIYKAAMEQRRSDMYWAEKTNKEKEEIRAIIRFVVDCVGLKESYHHIGGEGMALTMSSVLRKLMDRIDSLVAPYVGLATGHRTPQPDEIDEAVKSAIAKRNANQAEQRKEGGDES